MPAFEKISFYQQLSFGRRVSMEVDGNRDLHTHYQSLFKTMDQSYPLDLISSRPGISKNINLGAGIAALVLLLIIGVCLIGFVQNPERFVNPLIVLSSLFLPPALVALYFFNASFTPYVVFFRSDDGEELFKIRQQPKDKEKISVFARQLSERIEAIRYPTNMTLNEQMELYQRHLEFLLDEEVITQEEHDKIQGRIQKRKAGASVFKLV